MPRSPRGGARAVSPRRAVVSPRRAAPAVNAKAVCGNQYALATEIGYRQGVLDGRRNGRVAGRAAGIADGNGFIRNIYS